jgi:hypothetical protein
LVSLCFYCKDSSLEIDSVASYFSIGNELFPIARAGLVNLGEDFENKLYEGFMNVLLFVTEDVYFTEEDSGELLLKGKGALMGVIVYSMKKWELESGDYFVNLRPPYLINDIGIGFYTSAFMEENVNGPYFDYEGVGLLAGKMTVENLTDKIKIMLSFIDEQGQEITAFYSGTLQELKSFIKPPIENLYHGATLYSQVNSH